MTSRDITFDSSGTRCSATHHEGQGDAYATDAGRPCVVMAHGLGGTRDTGLSGFIESFAAAGLSVLAFDYRGFAASEGATRQLVSYRAQRRDYHAAIGAARELPGVDPTRLVLWGTSYSGGHVVPVGVEDGAIAAAISMTPAMDGAMALRLAVKRSGPMLLIRLTGHGLRDLARAATKRDPHLVTLASEPGDLGFLDAPGARQGYESLAGPTWRNEITARTALEVGLNRPIRYAKRVSFPLLIQIGDDDQTVPASASTRAGRLAGDHATVRHYPLDHFDVYDGGSWHERVLADQLSFLDERLAASRRLRSA